MKKLNLILTGFVATLWMFMGTDVMGQGSLTPPGAPGETMHTLEEVYERTDPRTPISSLPYTISEPGSYYVTGKLGSTGHGIVIESSGVTVDLMGFSLTGDGGLDDYGIHVAGATNAMIDKVVIKNGTVSGFYRGLRCDYMNNSRIEQMVVSGNASAGVQLNGGYYGQCDGNTITDCTLSGNGDWGVYLDGLNGQCDGNTIRENTISKNLNRGISLRYAEGNRVEGNNVWGTSGAGTTYGIRTAVTTDNFILKNTCVGQVNNFALDIDDTYGPIVTSSGALSGTDPWANFSR